ncbi:MAG TPA: glycosyltransferase family 39 protein [Pirellulales bacterium]
MSISHSPARAPFGAVRGVRAHSAVKQQTHVADGVCRVILLVIMAGVLIGRLDHAIVPHDDGTIGQTAERVLHGELPHHDFDDPYTGLLSFLNAAAFRWIGVSILSTRLVLLTATLIAFLALYGLSRRILPEWVAALSTAAAFLASVPNYFSPMPTWYNLYCTIFAVVAMLHYHDTQRLRWVAVAGFCTGVSFLFKLVGIYFAAAAALFVIFAEQQRADAQPASGASARGYWYTLTIAGLWVYVAMLTAMVTTLPKVPEFVMFVAPSAVIATLLTWNEWRLRHRAARDRFLRLLAIGAVFFAGFTATVAFYLLPYVAVGDVSSWFRGVFVSPMRRLGDNLIGPSLRLGPFLLGALLLTALAAAIGVARKYPRAAPWAAGVITCAAAALCLAGEYPIGYAAVWNAARLTPLAASLGLTLCAWIELRRTDSRRGTAAGNALPHVEETLLIVATAAVFSLVQFPLSHGIYFLYAAPLVILAGAYTLALLFPAPVSTAALGRPSRARSAIARSASAHKPRRAGAPLVVTVFATAVAAFSILWVLPGLSVAFGLMYYPARWTARIPGARCPIRCDRPTAQKYGRLIQQVTRHSSKGSAILALPDSPEVYFLTGRRNPTRTFFDALDADYGTPERDQRLLDTIERQQIDVVVLRNLVEFSPLGASPALQRELVRRFPHAKQIAVGRRRVPGFTVRWRHRRPERRSTPPSEVAHR